MEVKNMQMVFDSKSNEMVAIIAIIDGVQHITYDIRRNKTAVFSEYTVKGGMNEIVFDLIDNEIYYTKDLKIEKFYETYLIFVNYLEKSDTN